MLDRKEFIMARTVFGIFNLWLSEKQKLDASVGREISTDLNGKELTILANQYGVNNVVVELAYQMWCMVKPTKASIERVCQRAVKLNMKERVFLYNSLVPSKDMVYDNTDINRQKCRGQLAATVALESHDIGLFSLSDNYFWNDKDFGFMSFNELRSSELSGAIQDWFDIEK